MFACVKNSVLQRKYGEKIPAN